MSAETFGSPGSEAGSGGQSRSADTTPPCQEGWKVWHSDAGRLWATRTRPFRPDEERAGAYRTVDADTDEQLAALITEQERRAESVQ
ncbi:MULTISPECIES: hypothetical protein [Sphaerimonospora]|uniref:Uncharacterized protein n=1 Tax=Sphaerimonospora cavernae TaxID=1740611 RepID=A0ABV6U0M2_9ACTN|nr:hypothetical protein [Sphaerimonospora thailandensis]